MRRSSQQRAVAKVGRSSCRPLLWALLALSLVAKTALAEEVTPYEYVILIGRGPDRLFVQCRRVPPDSGFITDPDVGGYYPYHLARGQNHCVIVAPANAVPMYWFEAEKRYARWLNEATGRLETCRQASREIEQAVQAQRAFAARVEAYSPGWQKWLDAARERYVRYMAPGVKPAELDVLRLWDELNKRKEALLGTDVTAPAAPPEPSAPEAAAPQPAPPQQPATPGEQGPKPPTPQEQLPSPAHLLALPTPNNDGTHITLIWPLRSLDLLPRPRQEPKVAPQPPHREGAAQALTAEQQRELAEIETRLKALAEAHRWASCLAESQAKMEENRQALAKLRDGYVGDAAQFSLVWILLETETRLQVAGALGVKPDEITSARIAEAVPLLRQRLQEASPARRSPLAQASDYDTYDQLRYALGLAEAGRGRGDKPVALEQVEDDLLWRLQASIAGGDLGPQKAAAQAAPPTPKELLDAVAAYRTKGLAMDTDLSGKTLADWKAVGAELDGPLSKGWVNARTAELLGRLEKGQVKKPDVPFAAREQTRLTSLAKAASRRRNEVLQEFAERRYYFRLAVVPVGQPVVPETPQVASKPASATPDSFDESKLVNLAFVLLFMGAVLFMIGYVRRNPHIFIRRIAGLEAVDEAIGRATEMGQPVLFVHGLTGVSDIAVLASLAILSRIARRIADYQSALLVVNNDPIVYSVSTEVVQEGYAEAGKPDAFKADNIIMAASDQFPYVVAVAGIMARRRPAANFFMGYFFAESLILAEAGAATGAIQIAGTDSFTQLPFFITTCDYTLMGEELYAASAYLSREPRMLGTIKAQDFGKAILLLLMPAATVLGALGSRVLQVLLTAYEKGG